MSDTYRYCPDCGDQREFARYHAESEICPDTLDGRCPEWFCVACGKGVFVELLPLASATRGDATSPDVGLLDRVA